MEEIVVGLENGCCKVTRRDGTVEYLDADGYEHREDGPAVERADGSKFWYKHGLRHRLDGPAVENANGHRSWWVDDQRHREDGPAVIHMNGAEEYYLMGFEIPAALFPHIKFVTEETTTGTTPHSVTP